MIKLEYKEELNEEYYKIVDDEFNKYAIEKGVECNFRPFSFVAKENNVFVGLIKGHSYYKEVHIADLIILEKYRHQNIGSMLVKVVEDYFKGKGFENINLTTYGFQALEFYKKCGYEVEFIRKSKKDSKLDKYFLVKYL